MKQKRSHVVIFCAYLGMVAYGNITMLASGWTVWALSVAAFAGTGLIMAWAMFKEPKQGSKTGSERRGVSENQSPAASAPSPSPGSDYPPSRRWPFRSRRPRPQPVQQAAASLPGKVADSIMARLGIEYRIKVAEARTLGNTLDILQSFVNAIGNEGKELAGGKVEDDIKNAKELLGADPKSWEEAELGTDLGSITLNLRKGQQVAAKPEPEKGAEPETAFDASGAEDVNP